MLCGGAAFYWFNRVPVYPIPQGFAEIKGRPDNPVDSRIFLRAINPAGVVYRVRAIKSGEKADLKFWAEILKKKFEKQGYPMVAEAAISGRAKAEGRQMTVGSNVKGTDYLMSVALFPRKSGVLLVEAAGPKKDFEAAQVDILNAISR